MSVVTWSSINKDADLIVNGTTYNTATTVARFKPIKVDKPIVETCYFEQKINSTSNIKDCLVGVIIEDAGITSWGTNTANAKKATMYRSNGTIWRDGLSIATSLETWTIDDIIGVAVDPISKKVSFYKNNSLIATVDYFSEINKNVVGASIAYVSASVNGYFDMDSLNYSPPNGYSAYGLKSRSKILLLGDDSKAKRINRIDTMPIEHTTKMTSDILPQPLKASASSIINANYLAYKAFNGTAINGADHWQTDNFVTKAWISLDFGEPKPVDTVKITTNLNVANQSPKSFKIEGSLDGLKWEEMLDIKNEKAWVLGETRVFNFSLGMHRYYRVNVIEGFGGSAIAIAKIAYSNSNTYSKYYATNIISQSEKSFIKHGMSQSDLASIDMSADFTEKHYIQDTSTVLGNGKVFEQVLDMSKVLKKISIN